MTAPTYELFAVRYAHRRGHRGEHFLDHDDRCDAPMPMAYFTWLAVGGGRRIVIDTGFTAETARARGRTYLAAPAATIGRLGVTPDEVTDVILTHLHYDHAGTTADFGAARLTLQECEMQHWTGPDAQRGPNPHLAEAGDIAHLVHANLARRVRWVDGDDEVVPGVSVHLVGGHTPGMQVVRVRTASGHAVVASDAAHFYENLETDRPYPVVHHVTDAHGAFEDVARLADDPALIVAGHDPAVMERYPAAADELADRAVRVA